MSREKNIYEEFQMRFPEMKKIPVWAAYEEILKCCMEKGKILVCGNGGSASDSEHIVGELMKGFRLERKLSEEEQKHFKSIEGGVQLAETLQKGIPAISLNSHTALMTAVGNDVSYKMVFAQQVYGYGAPGDVLIALSTSGNSENVLEAAKTAKVKKMKVIGITGSKESQLERYSDICLKMPDIETYRIQEYTLPLYHTICAMLEERLFGE